MSQNPGNSRWNQFWSSMGCNWALGNDYKEMIQDMAYKQSKRELEDLISEYKKDIQQHFHILKLVTNDIQYKERELEHAIVKGRSNVEVEHLTLALDLVLEEQEQIKSDLVIARRKLAEQQANMRIIMAAPSQEKGLQIMTKLKRTEKKLNLNFDNELDDAEEFIDDKIADSETSQNVMSKAMYAKNPRGEEITTEASLKREQKIKEILENARNKAKIEEKRKPKKAAKAAKKKGHYKEIERTNSFSSSLESSSSSSSSPPPRPPSFSPPPSRDSQEFEGSPEREGSGGDEEEEENFPPPPGGELDMSKLNINKKKMDSPKPISIL